jgi:regulatory GntR family protein
MTSLVGRLCLGRRDICARHVTRTASSARRHDRRDGEILNAPYTLLGIPDENELASEFGVTVGVIRETLQALEREVVLVRAARVKDIVLDKVEHRLSGVAIV